MSTGDRDHGSGSRSEISGSSRDVVQAANVSGGVHFHEHREPPRDSGGTPRPQQLPRDVRTFVNRTHELDSLNAVLTDDDGDHRVVSVCVIAGTAGAGKTSLALRWAHRLRDRFPDGQLYVNLRGYDPGEPVTADEALRRFLAALGVPVAAVPADPETAAALYRSLLAERRMLILLDNAATVSQVRPLLPGNSRCLAVVTSRGRLSGLAVRDGAHRVTLGTLPESEAVALLRAVIAGFRPDDDSEKLSELARLCARLPLALRIAAERAVSRPHMGLDELIADLSDESALWEALTTDDEEEANAVRSVFAWSYRALPPDAARLFRLLGLHPGPEFGVGAAAAVAGISVRRARQLLDVLVGACVLEQSAADRYEFHDLLRAYATDQAQDEESAEDRLSALVRVLDWYLHTADAAQTLLKPTEDRVPLDPPGDGVTPVSFVDYDGAVDWAEREHGNFLPAVRAAERAGLDRHTWRLSAVLWNAQAPSTIVTDWLAMEWIGLQAARRIGDRTAEAGLLGNLGYGHARISELAESEEYQREALRIRRELGERSAEADVLNALGLVSMRRRMLGDAEFHFGQAIDIFAALGAAHGEALALSNLATVHYQSGHLTEAAEVIHRALTTLRAENDRFSVGNGLRLLSAISLDRGEPDDALRAAGDALEIAAELRDLVVEGYWLLALGDAQRVLGRFADALTSYQRSAVLHRRFGNRTREALAWQGAGATYERLGRRSEAAEFQRRAVAVHRELGDGWNLALALDGLAAALREERPEEARRYWGDALGLLENYGDARAGWERERIRGLLAEADGPQA